MLAVFFLWLLIATVLKMVTVLPGWQCAIIAAIPLAIWVFKRPQDF